MMPTIAEYLSHNPVAEFAAAVDALHRPKRIQRKRTKGWRMPEGAVYVGRPTRWGNPFEAYKCHCCGYWDVRDDNGVTYLVNHEYVRQPHVRADRTTWTTRHHATREAVRLYSDEATYWLGGWAVTRPDLWDALPSLRGRDLACWCPLDQPCHADVLLALANQTSGAEGAPGDADSPAPVETGTPSAPELEHDLTGGQGTLPTEDGAS